MGCRCGFLLSGSRVPWFYTIRSLILTCAIGRLLNTESKIYGFKDTGLWFHTVACAIVSEIISKKTHPDICTAAFTAGLLHDVGHLVIGTQLPEKTDTIEDFMVNEGVSLIQAERETLGFSHDEAGALLAEFWRFPDELRDAIRYHHSPMESPQPSALTSIVHLADSLVLDLGYGIELEQLKYEPQDLCTANVVVVSEVGDLRQHAEEQYRSMPCLSKSLKPDSSFLIDGVFSVNLYEQVQEFHAGVAMLQID